MFAAKYGAFLVDNETECEVFEFDDLWFTNCLFGTISKSAHEFVSPSTFESKPLSDSLMYAFLGSHESLPIIIASNLD